MVRYAGSTLLLQLAGVGVHVDTIVVSTMLAFEFYCQHMCNVFTLLCVTATLNVRWRLMHFSIVTAN